MDNENENNTHEDHSEIAAKDLMGVIGGVESAIVKIAELSNSICNAMENMDEKIENISAELSSLTMAVDFMKSDIGSVETDVRSLASDMGEVDSKVFAIGLDIDSIKLDVEYLEKDHDNIKDNLMNIAFATNAEYQVGSVSADSTSSSNDVSDSSSLDDDEEGSVGDWDYQKEDKSCKMCAGTGFMGAGDEEEDETGCDEVTCPFCQGSGIE